MNVRLPHPIHAPTLRKLQAVLDHQFGQGSITPEINAYPQLTLKISSQLPSMRQFAAEQFVTG
jgi:hypothetical protein